MRHWIAATLALCGCHGKDEAVPPKLMDTGWFDTTTTPLACDDRYVAWVPEDGEASWYWRDRPVLFTQTTDQTAYEAWLQDDQGNRVETTSVWDETGLSFTLEFDGQLAASTDYTMVLRDCADTYTIAFHTSQFGDPLDVNFSDLIGNTYLLDLVGARWVEPAALGGLMALYFNTPILLGVRYADSKQIDLIGAPGVADLLGNVTQELAPTWDFPMADFTDQPYLDAQVSQITLQYVDGYTPIDIPVEDFVFQGTFSPDGTLIGGGMLSGLGDSRNLGALLNDPTNPAALCDLASGLGVQCVACDDGGPYCLNLVAEAIDGNLLESLVLVER